jgi:thioredoxin 1
MSYRTISSFGNKNSVDNNHLHKITRKEDKQTLISNYKLVVIDIYADWCSPCKIVSPEFNKLYSKYNIDNVCTLAKENVDLGLSPSVTVVPTFQFFYKGVLDSIITGADITQVEGKIIEMLNKIEEETRKEKASTVALEKNPLPPPPTKSTIVNLPPQLQKQFQYQDPTKSVKQNNTKSKVAEPVGQSPQYISTLPNLPKFQMSRGSGGGGASSATNNEASVDETPSMTNGEPQIETAGETPAQTEVQSVNEGFQHAHNLRQQYNDTAPAHLPMSLPIRRKK